MNTPRNYQELSDAMLALFSDVSEGTVPLETASVLVKTSNAVINIQRAKIMATRVQGEERIRFFEEVAPRRATRTT